MDVQGATVKMLNNESAFLDSITKAIEAARNNKIQVIYVVVGFRPGYPEVSSDNKSFSLLKSGTLNLDTKEATEIPEVIRPKNSDIVVIKKRVSAFAGSDLEIVLRSSGIKSLLLTGIATSGVVLSTLREAADKDYKISVLSDCCADRDEEVHHVLMTKIFPRQAEVLDLSQWIANNQGK